MKPNKVLRAAILGTVDNQLKSNNPPETRLTYERLISEGDDDENARLRIAQCIAVEIYNVLKYQQPFNSERYIRNLNNLPEEPFDD